MVGDGIGGEGEWISLAGIRGATLVRHSSSVARCAVDVWGLRAEWHILVSVTYVYLVTIFGGRGSRHCRLRYGDAPGARLAGHDGRRVPPTPADTSVRLARLEQGI